MGSKRCIFPLSFALLLLITAFLSSCQGSSPTPISTLTPALLPAWTETPAQTLTREEEIRLEILQNDAIFPSQAECPTPSAEQSYPCAFPDSVLLIERPEWKELFPQANFYLVKIISDDMGHRELVNYFIVEQDGKRYNEENFHRLLKDDSIVITEENREMVAKAFVLLNLPGHIQGEVVFLEAKEVNLQGGGSVEKYNYQVTIWTEIQGWVISYRFGFYDGHLRVVRSRQEEGHVGNYIDVSWELLKAPKQIFLVFGK